MSDDNKEGAGVPVAVVGKGNGGGVGITYLPALYSLPHGTKLYATPPAAMPAAPSDAVLSDDQIDALQEEYDCFGECDAPRLHDFARGVERTVRATLSQKAGAVAQCPNCKGTRAPSPLDPDWRGRCECAAPGAAIAAREQEATFEQWWSRQQGAAKGRLPGDDFLMLDEDDKGQYEAAFNAGRRLASRDEAPATPQGETLIGRVAELMRGIDAYAYDYRTDGKLAASRQAVSNALLAAFNADLLKLIRTQPTTVQQAPTDEELAAAAYKGYDSYWTEDCAGKESEAWLACAKAVLALKGMQPGERKEQE